MKRLRSKSTGIDGVDVAILEALATDARTTMADLGRAVGLSPPSVAERVRRLEDAAVIQGYTVLIDAAALGLPLTAYIRIRPMSGQLRKVAELLDGIASIVECDRVTGDDCFVARAYLRSIEELETVIDQIIPYATTNTSIIQSSPVRRRLPPLAPAAP